MKRNPLNKEEILRRTEVFFNSQQWKNTLLFFSFVLLASCFWMLQYFRQRIEFEVPVRIEYVHTPAWATLSGKLPQEITLYVQDKGSAYLNYLHKQKKNSLFISVDLEMISPSKTSYVVENAVLNNLINENLSSTTQLKSFSPDKIEINYSLLAQKELPVVIDGTISPASGYLFLDSILIEPAKAVAYGNKNALDSLWEIRTLPLNYQAIDKDWTIFAGLQIPEGIGLSVDNVKLSATVEEFTEKTFELPVVCYNLPSNLRVHFFPSTVELNVRVGLSEYSQLSKANFEIAVDYNDLKAKDSANCSLTLTRKPLWLKTYRIVPDVIEFLFEQKNN